MKTETIQTTDYAGNLHFRGNHPESIIPCKSEKAGDAAFHLFAEGLRMATGERPLVL